jgi:hypothetical protein
MPRFQLAAEQAAHANSGPRRRPRELPGSFVTQRDFGRTTHINCSRYSRRDSPIWPPHRGRSIGGTSSISLRSALFAPPIFAKASRRRGNRCMSRDSRAWLSNGFEACDLLADFTRGKSLKLSGHS